LTTRYPAVVVSLVVLLLAALAWQARGLQGTLTPPQASVNADDDPRAGYLEHQIGTVFMSVVDVVITGDHADRLESAITPFLARIGQDDDFAPVVTIETNEQETLTVIRALVVRPPGSAVAITAVERLRERIVPLSFADTPATVLVSGPLALHGDVLSAVQFWQRWIIGGICLLTMVLLTAMFRSLVVALLAVVTTCLSVAAALGLMVLVIQRGVGAGFLRLTTVPAIEAWVPVVLFCIVFGLSMDYYVFLLSRIRETYVQTGDIAVSIRTGVQATGSVIFGASLIMIVIFAGFTTGRLMMLQQIGFGLAAAVLIDAWLVRLMLIPACMTLIGRWNWPRRSAALAPPEGRRERQGVRPTRSSG
jgi:RND superfamily putative drug exporter